MFDFGAHGLNVERGFKHIDATIQLFYWLNNTCTIVFIIFCSNHFSVLTVAESLFFRFLLRESIDISDKISL